ncbi:putative LRR receptor-like serine/threonine-protein kinase [Prunus yedoensis var. nudiflora]|uniref:Putative LRR receptor-like serine/threonine-protein kinase n=1 Tax=Prunus yedoensis var. nudiflora TaxID=2094558 RepID=A0A314UWA4_PRUYE|nr:putative LRR receptor-like serine/threonine-protein kinase [Prunus yedoensis var. nudiflora]
MAKLISSFLCRHNPMILVFIFLSALNFVFSQTPDVECVIDIQASSSWRNSSCEAGNWGGFISNCCEVVFDDYLYALGQRANQTGKLFLNSTEQTNCLVLMKGIKEDVLSCGIEKLTSGAGGCSDYTRLDVFNNLRNTMESLEEDCKLLGTAEISYQVCSACLKRWEEIVASSDNERGPSKVEANICGFAVLVSLTSKRIDDKDFVQALYECLGDQGLSADEQRSSGTNAINLSTASNDSHSEEPGSLKISIKEIYAATNNLSAVNFIGQGGAGKVYKGILSNGKHVAVKHIINDGSVETFIREVTSLSDVRHPNLVALLGYCEDVEECFLVYELCQNGNLSEWLFGKDKSLPWITRLELAVDSARGLWFLHTYPDGCIVHRDIKPTNILIDNNFQAKLSDFGLSKVMDLGQSYVSSEVRGTFGYVDPEYRRNHHVNSSGDVYSFGIVLLQLISGRRVINLNSQKPMPLSKMARALTKGGDVTEFADPKLNGEYSGVAFDLVFNLALSCTGLKLQRPGMEQVVSKLEKALDISTQMEPISLTAPLKT